MEYSILHVCTFEILMAFALNRVVQIAMLLASREYWFFAAFVIEKVAGVRTKPRCAISNAVGVHGILHFAFFFNCWRSH